MRIPFKSLLMLALLALLAVFVWQNETAFFGRPTDPPSTLRFLGAPLHTPVGVGLPAFIGVLCLLFVLFALSLRAQTLIELRRSSKEMDASRRLADSAELSRFNALRIDMTAHFAELTAEVTALHNSLAASLAELEDRLLPPNGPSQS